MPFESTTMYIVLAVFAWILGSWSVYRAIANMPASKRDWTDRTLPRRAGWVLLGPFTWIIAILMGATLTIYLVSKDLAKLARATWKNKKQNPSARTIARRTRWAQFRSNT